MAEELQDAQQGVQVFIDDRDLRVLYVNTYRFFTTPDEVITELAFNMPNPTPNPQGGQQQMLWKVSDRLIMSYPTAKRFAVSLAQLIKRYEQQFGELPAELARNGSNVALVFK